MPRDFQGHAQETHAPEMHAQKVHASSLHVHKEHAHADIRIFTYVWPIKEIECHSAIVQLGRKCRKLSFAV